MRIWAAERPPPPPRVFGAGQVDRTGSRRGRRVRFGARSSSIRRIAAARTLTLKRPASMRAPGYAASSADIARRNGGSNGRREGSSTGRRQALTPAFRLGIRWPRRRFRPMCSSDAASLRSSKWPTSWNRVKAPGLGDEGCIDGDERGSVVPQRKPANGVRAKLQLKHDDAGGFHSLAPAVEGRAGVRPLNPGAVVRRSA